MKTHEIITRVLAGEDVPGFPMKLPPPVAALIGFEAVSVEAGRAVFRMETSVEKHANPMGTVHGGILCDIADAAMGMACASLLEAGESFTTLELKTNFFRPVWNATLEARANVVHRGKSLMYVECNVVQVPEEKLVARVASTCTVLRGTAAEGR